jgi:hypothetical protein
VECNEWCNVTPGDSGLCVLPGRANGEKNQSETGEVEEIRIHWRLTHSLPGRRAVHLLIFSQCEFSSEDSSTPGSADSCLLALITGKSVVVIVS